MGGIVGCFVAGSISHRVLSLTLIDTVGAIGLFSADAAPKLLQRSLEQRTVMISRKPRTYDTFAECLQRWSESPYAPRGEENLRLIVARGTEEIVDPNGFVSGFRFRHDPKLKSLPPFKIGEDQVQEFLKSVQAPCVAILATDRDPIWPESIEGTHLELLRAKVYRVKGGHHPHMTNVEETEEIIMSLLEPFKYTASKL